MVKIEDGTGKGFSVDVNSKNRLVVQSVSEGEALQATKDSDCYKIDSGTINLTSAGKSAVLYVKNTGDSDLIIDELVVNQGTSTGGVGDSKAEVIRNPTAGTIVSGASAANQSNKNFGSTKTLSGDLFKGAEGNTITDGSQFIEEIFSQQERKAIKLGIVVPKNSSIGINFTPPPGNTSMDIVAILTAYLASV